MEAESPLAGLKLNGELTRLENGSWILEPQEKGELAPKKRAWGDVAIMMLLATLQTSLSLLPDFQGLSPVKKLAIMDLLVRAATTCVLCSISGRFCEGTCRTIEAMVLERLGKLSKLSPEGLLTLVLAPPELPPPPPTHPAVIEALKKVKAAGSREVPIGHLEVVLCPFCRTGVHYNEEKPKKSSHRNEPVLCGSCVVAVQRECKPLCQNPGCENLLFVHSDGAVAAMCKSCVSWGCR